MIRVRLRRYVPKSCNLDGYDKPNSFYHMNLTVQIYLNTAISKNIKYWLLLLLIIFCIHLQELGDLYRNLGVEYNLAKYPNIHITKDHTTVMLAPKCYCNPNDYLFHYNMTSIIVQGHKLINNMSANIGCPNGMYSTAVRLVHNNSNYEYFVIMFA